MPKRRPWKTSPFLRADQRDALDDLAERIRKATGYKPTYSELVRASIDALLPRLQAEGFDDLAADLQGLLSRDAFIVVLGDAEFYDC